MRRFAVGVEYCGAAFAGWQRQAGARTVEAELCKALSAVADETVRVICGGRTDAGVHGMAQVAHFDTAARRSLHAWLVGVNGALPADVALRWVRPVSGHFHARFSALGRCYRYVVLNRATRPALWRGRAWWVRDALNVEAMQNAGQDLLGEHDFTAFRAARCQSRSPVRRVDALRVWREGEWLAIEITANAFLHHMVRNIVGLLVAVGRGRAAASWAGEVLRNRDRRLAALTAPADGLYLARIDYPAAFGLPMPGNEGAGRGSGIIMPTATQG